MSRRQIKCVIVGDETVGKTSLLLKHSTGSFPDKPIPSVLDVYSTEMSVDDNVVDFSVWDTAGQEENDRAHFSQADVFIVCFSTISPASADSVERKWVPEIRHKRPDAPILLLGTKIDLREDGPTLCELKSQNIVPVSPSLGLKLSFRIKAVQYNESSARKDIGVAQIFNDAVRAVMNPKPPQKEDKCSLQ